MSRDIHVHVEERHYAFLRQEADLTGLAMAELIRRAIDFTYLDAERPRIKGWQASIGLWRNPDAAAVGRRAGVR
jgi:hypothetical protein